MYPCLSVPSYLEQYVERSGGTNYLAILDRIEKEQGFRFLLVGEKTVPGFFVLKLSHPPFETRLFSCLELVLYLCSHLFILSFQTSPPLETHG